MLIASILIYLLFAGIMYFLAENARKSESVGQNKNAILSVLLIILFFSLLSGVRYRVGSDCEEYAESYQLLLDGKDMSNSITLSRAEPGFLIISKFMALLHLPRFVYMGFWAMLEILFLALAFRNRIYLLPLLLPMLVLGPYYMSFMNGVRQSVVSCIFVYAVVQLIDFRKWGKYLFLILLSMLIHRSALLLLPFVFIIRYDKKPNAIVCLSLYICCLIAGHLPIVREYALLAETILKVVGYSDYADRIEHYAGLESIITSFGPRSLILLLINVIIIMFSNAVSSRFKNDRLYNVSFLFFMLYACGSGIMTAMDGLFSRPLLYFLPFVLICQAYTLLYLYKPDPIYDFKWFKIRMPKMVAACIFCGAIVVFCSYCLLFNVAECNTPDETILFKFTFLQ